MTDEWYFRSGGEEAGPVSFAELLAKGQAGELSLDDTIRQGSEGNWIPVESISSLFPNLKTGSAGTSSPATLPDNELQELHDLSELFIEIESGAAAAPSDELEEAVDLSEVTIDASSDPAPATADELEQVHDLSELSVATAGPIDGAEEFELSDDPTHVEWFARVVGVEMGPMPWQDLQQMVEHGELSVDDEVRPNSHTAWSPAGQVPLLFTGTVSASGGSLDANSELDVVRDLSELDIELDATTGARDSDDEVQHDASAGAESDAVGQSNLDTLGKSETWYANVLGAVYGPMSYDELRAMALRKEVGPADLVRRSEHGAWGRPGTYANLLDSTGAGLTRDVADASDDWYCNVFGAELGPMSFADLHAMARNDELSSDDRVRFGEKGAWIAAGTVDALSSEFPSKSAESSAAPELSLAEFEFVESIDEAMSQAETRPVGVDAPQEQTGSVVTAAAADVREHDGAAESPSAGRPYEKVAPAEEPVGTTVSAAEDSSVDEDEPAVAADPQSTSEWYVRMHDVEHGPLDFEELKHLIELNRISVESEVRLGVRGAWVRAGSVSSLAQAATSAVVTSAPQLSPAWTTPPAALRSQPMAATPARSSPASRSESPLAGLLARRRDHILWGGAVAVVLLLLAVTVPWLFGGHDEDDLAVYTTIWNEHKELRSRGASQSEWQDFQQRVKERVEPIVERLEKTASAEKKIRQHLLWAGRDYLPLMVVDAREDPSESEELFAEHLKDAMALLAGHEPEGPWVDEQEGRIDELSAERSDDGDDEATSPDEE